MPYVSSVNNEETTNVVGWPNILLYSGSAIVGIVIIYIVFKTLATVAWLIIMLLVGSFIISGFATFWDFSKPEEKDNST